MYFRSFNAFEKPIYWERSEFDKNGERIYTLDDLGKEIVYSEKIKFNPFCLLGELHYHEVRMADEKNWQVLFKKYAEYAREYLEIGFVTFYDEESEQYSILTQTADVNAYSELRTMSSFLIFFNARPSRIGIKEDVVTVGYDRYSFENRPGSIIVWDLDKYRDLNLDGFTLWGIRQNTGVDYSLTDDEFVGIKNGEEIFAVR